MLSVLALGMGPNPAGTYSETEAEPETAGHVACELAVLSLLACSLQIGPHQSGMLGDPDRGNGHSDVAPRRTVIPFKISGVPWVRGLAWGCVDTGGSRVSILPLQ